MSWVLLQRIVALVLAVAGGERQLGTIFGSSSWDASNPKSRLACLHREIDDRKDLVVAHNVLPCKTRILIVNPRTRRSVVAIVADRGPRHADIDLSPRVARELKHNGREEVIVVPLDPVKPEMRLASGAPDPTLPDPTLSEEDLDEVSLASRAAASAH